MGAAGARLTDYEGRTSSTQASGLTDALALRAGLRDGAPVALLTEIKTGYYANNINSKTPNHKNTSPLQIILL